MPQPRMYTGKIIKSTADLKEIPKLLEGNENINLSEVHEVIHVRVYSHKIGVPPDNFKPANFDAYLLNTCEPIALRNIYAKDISMQKI